jgi:hypothetical protein
MGLTDYSIMDKRYFESGREYENEKIVNLLKENSKCTLDGGHDTNGYCFCEAIELIKEKNN